MTGKGNIADFAVMAREAGKKSAAAFIILLLILMLLLIYARFIEPVLLVTKRVHIGSDKPERQIQAVFFTDTHFSRDYSQENASRIVEKINGLNPDIVVFGGDFLDNYTKDCSVLDLEYIKDTFSQIKASCGKYAIFGNHEYGGGFSEKYTGLMREAGFITLRNSAAFIESLNVNIIGVDDFLLGKPCAEIDTLKRDSSYNVLITHSPDYVDYVNIAGIDLVLAGHTHGKQLLFFNRFKYAKGFYSTGSSQLYVSAGIGLSGPPFRFSNPPEIVSFTIYDITAD